MDGLDAGPRAEGLLEHAGAVHRGMERGPAAREHEAPGRAEEGPHVEVLEDPLGLSEERGLRADHVVHVVGVAGARVPEGDHGRPHLLMIDKIRPL